MTGWTEAFFFFLPAGIANATPVLANKIPGIKKWQTPMDLGKNWRGKRLLGPNKTWRGVLTGSLLGGLTGILVFAVADNGRSLAASFLLSFIMGFGALLGDAIESSIKRRRGKAAGQSWFPFDQLDYIIGGLLLVYPFASLAWSEIGQIFVLYFGLHLLTAYFAFLVGLKDQPI